MSMHLFFAYAPSLTPTALKRVCPRGYVIGEGKAGGLYLERR